MSDCHVVAPPELPALTIRFQTVSHRSMYGVPVASVKYWAVPVPAVAARNRGLTAAGPAVPVAVASPAVAHASGGGPDSCCCCGHWKCFRHVCPGLNVGAAAAETVTTVGFSAVAVAVAVSGGATVLSGTGGCWLLYWGLRNQRSHV